MLYCDQPSLRKSFGNDDTYIVRKRYVKRCKNGLSPLGKIIAVTCTTPLVKLFGNDQAAWVKTMTVWAVIALILLLICFINCKETVVIAGQEKAEKVPVKKGSEIITYQPVFLGSTFTLDVPECVI